MHPTQKVIRKSCLECQELSLYKKLDRYSFDASQVRYFVIALNSGYQTMYYLYFHTNKLKPSVKEIKNSKLKY